MREAVKLLSAPKFSDRGVGYATTEGRFLATDPSEIPDHHWTAMGPALARKVRLRLEGHRVRQHLGQLVWVTEAPMVPFHDHWSCQPVPLLLGERALCWIMLDSPSREPGKLRYRAALKELEARGVEATLTVAAEGIRLEMLKPVAVTIPQLGTVRIDGDRLIPQAGGYRVSVAAAVGLERLGHNMRRQDAPGNYRMLVEAIANQIVGRPPGGWRWTVNTKGTNS